MSAFSSPPPNDPGLPLNLPGQGGLAPCITDAKYGAKSDGSTDDTTAVQNAMNAVSAIGTSVGQKIPLIFPPGTTTILSSVVPQPYVDIRGYGAAVKRNPSFSTGASLFFHNPAIGFGVPLTEFALRGLRMIPLGGENADQGMLRISRSTHIFFEDIRIDNLAANPLYAIDCQYVWANRNRLLNCTVQNPINFVNGSYGVTLPLQHLWAEDNVVSSPAIPIAVVSDQTATRTDPIVDAHIANNTCISTGSGWPIAIESGGSGPPPPNMSVFDIAGNTCIQQGTGLYGITAQNDSTPASNDPLCISEVTIRGNRIFANVTNGSGIGSQASRCSIVGNIIEATQHDVFLYSHGTAVIGNIAVTGNVGHLGSGDEIHIFGSGVDTTTLTSTNTQ